MSSAISALLVNAINRQIAQENEASFYYLSMAHWADLQGLPGAAAFFYRHSEEERGHMRKLMDYLLELEIKPQIPIHTQSSASFASLKSLCEAFLAHEKEVTASIHRLVEAALLEKSFATFEFLQWFVREQREEEALALRALELCEIGSDGVALYEIDKALANLKVKIA